MRRIRRVEIRRRLAEIAPRGRLDPVVALAEIDGVQVLLEDLSLRLALLEPRGDEDLANLALVGPYRRQLRRARELLGDGAAALDDASGTQVPERGGDDTHRVDAEVLIEARSSTATMALTMCGETRSRGTEMRCSTK
jgi:hypothetical protein